LEDLYDPKSTFGACVASFGLSEIQDPSLQRARQLKSV